MYENRYLLEIKMLMFDLDALMFDLDALMFDLDALITLINIIDNTYVIYCQNNLIIVLYQIFFYNCMYMKLYFCQAAAHK